MSTIRMFHINVSCDKCGHEHRWKVGQKARSVRAEAKAESWKIGKGKDFCPSCRKDIEAAIAEAKLGNLSSEAS